MNLHSGSNNCRGRHFLGPARLVVAWLAVCLFVQGSPRAGAVDVYVQLSQHGRRINIGVAVFTPFSSDIKEAETARKIQEVLRHDLLFTRYFNVSEIDASLKDKPDERKVKLMEAGQRGVDVVVTGSVRIHKTECTLKAELYDAQTGENIFNMTFKDSPENYRAMAHELNDEIVLRFTGIRGIAHTKIAFVNDNTGSKEIYVVDYDGHNLRKLTSLGSICLFPRWSPDGKKIIFTTYRYGNPDLYVMNAEGSSVEGVSRRQGLNTAAVWLPDGKSILLTMSGGATPQIYEIDTKGKIIRQLTMGRAIDTSPSVSPAGREFVFVSDRAGAPQLYVSDVHGTNVRRLPTEGYVDSPSWSPRGDAVAFAMRPYGKNFFDIFLYGIANGSVRQMTFGSRSNESPSFSPDGRFIAYCSDPDRKKEIFLMFIDGSGQRRVGGIKGNSSMPSWSP
ncbi:MAG: Tol-Pal system beta propeller repeat protein TolB [Elusimicrobia bacterium]|nr:Tol-Pal system beta propeller repeat protein TolB [Elusimicrobiota bacterium]